MIILIYTLVLYVFNQFAKLHDGYFYATGKSLSVRKLSDLRVSVLSSYDF